MTERTLCNQFAGEHQCLPQATHQFSSGTKGLGSIVMTSLAVALRGLVVTVTAVMTIAYLLLTNSHI